MSDDGWDTESSDSNPGDSDVEIHEDANAEELGICPFCGETQDPDRLLTDHFQVGHNWDFVSVFGNRLAEDRRLGQRLDPQLSFVRWLNYVRREKLQFAESVAIFANDSKWHEIQENDDCLIPALSDGLLLIDVEEILNKRVAPNPDAAASNDTQSVDAFTDVQSLQQEVRRVREDLDRMRASMQHILGTGDASQRPNSGALPSSTAEIDTAYFASYSHYGIHLEMLRDRVRTDAYRDFLQLNADTLVAGRRWLDVGCGTGVLSAFAARGGAQHVVGVDCAEVVFAAQDMIKDNGLSERVSLLHGKLEELEASGEAAFQPRFDAVISEWMGYALLFESMLDSVLYAREHLLAPGGRIFPEVCRLLVCGAADSEPVKRVLHYWDDVYGLRMNAMRSQALREALVTIMPAACVATDAFELLTIDMSTVAISDTEFCRKVRLRATRDCVLDSLVLYFDTDFVRPCTVVDGVRQVSFSTGPLAPPTHWKQTVLLLEEPVQLTEGAIFEPEISIRRSRNDARALQIRVRHHNKKQIFSMD